MFVSMQALDSKLSLDTAMSLYGLEHSELFWEKALDTKLLMAWNKHTIVLAFRGTASFANALADLQVCFPGNNQTPHGKMDLGIAWQPHLNAD